MSRNPISKLLPRGVLLPSRHPRPPPPSLSQPQPQPPPPSPWPRLAQQPRYFSQTTHRPAIPQSPLPTATAAATATATETPAAPKDAVQNHMSSIIMNTIAKAGGVAPSSAVSVLGPTDAAGPITRQRHPPDFRIPYKFSVYASKQNTHITVAKPNGQSFISVSCGNLGFRKSHRKKFDSAFQLAGFVLDKMFRDGWVDKINMIELSLRGFGQGRDAAIKALTGYEGRFLSHKFVRVCDSTRIKFGGTKSRNPRRL